MVIGSFFSMFCIKTRKNIGNFQKILANVFWLCYNVHIIQKEGTNEAVSELY